MHTPRRPRRPLVASCVLLALVAAGCGSADPDGTASPAATAPRVSTAAPGSVVALAEAFAATLDDDQRRALQQAYTFANAANWSNLPNSVLTQDAGSGQVGAPSSAGRTGLSTQTLTDAQWTALDALLAKVSGSAPDEGFDEIRQHLAADDYLAENGGGEGDYGRGKFFVAFLGTPTDTGTWELQFGGHHLAVADTYVRGALTGATPSFRGMEPLTTVEENGVRLQAEQQEQAAFAALLASLDDTQRAAARLPQSYGDVLLGPGADWAFPATSEGLAGSGLSAPQKALLLAAVDRYVDDLDDADAAKVLARYRDQLDDTHLAFAGSGGVSDAGDYVRVDGPSVWIEFSLQDGIILQGAHPHAVWRDKQTDYAGLTS